MIEVDLQLKGKTLMPFSKEAADLISDFVPNQVIRGKLTGVQKPRSVDQLRMFWACCRTVAGNTDDPEWNTEEKVCWQVKHAIKFFKDTIVLPDGRVHFELASISFANLSQCIANKVFDRSWPVMADKIGITVDELLKHAKRYYEQAFNGGRP